MPEATPSACSHMQKVLHWQGQTFHSSATPQLNQQQSCQALGEGHALGKHCRHPAIMVSGPCATYNLQCTGPARGTHGSQFLVAARCQTRLATHRQRHHATCHVESLGPSQLLLQSGG
jgi:hypothetical protein